MYIINLEVRSVNSYFYIFVYHAVIYSLSVPIINFIMLDLQGEIREFSFIKIFITARICGEVMFLSCLSVCLSVCVSIRAVTFEADGIETFFLAQW